MIILHMSGMFQKMSDKSALFPTILWDDRLLGARENVS